MGSQSSESHIKNAITVFENDTNPIFVIYGDVSYFPELISEFRTYLQKDEQCFYITLDMEIAKRDTLADTCLEIFQQLIYWYRYIEQVLHPDEEAQIPQVWKRLKKLKEYSEKYEPAHKLAEIVRFVGMELYPPIKNISKRSNFLIELNRFEYVIQHGVAIRDIILEELLLNEVESSLRFVIFAKYSSEPPLYKGSNKEATLENITFHNLQGTDIPDNEQEKFGTPGKNIQSNDFDVFLCHNSIDKPIVKEIARQLKEKGIRPWLDEWELRPGLPWAIELEHQIEHINSAAVFIGTSGIGPWEDFELQAFLRQFVKRKCPVIPVILPDGEEVPKLPTFLEGMMWVDFRQEVPDPFQQLIWGITGKKPPSG